MRGRWLWFKKGFCNNLMNTYRIDIHISICFIFGPKCPNFIQFAFYLVGACMPHYRTIITHRVRFVLEHTFLFLVKKRVNTYHYYPLISESTNSNILSAARWIESRTGSIVKRAYTWVAALVLSPRALPTICKLAPVIAW